MEGNITVVQQSLEMMKVSWMQKKRKVHVQKLEDLKKFQRSQESLN